MLCEMNEPIVELKNVSKSFGKRLILDKICLKLCKSETISVVGDSGTGKTTLLNVLSLLEYPDDGEVFWEGNLASNASTKLISTMRGRRFGYIFQNHNLISELDAWENVLLPLNIRGKPKKSDLASAENLLNRVGLSERKNSRIEYLSGGEKQRVAIVRALINHPQVILADEPTGNLDGRSAYNAVSLMLELCKFTKSSLIFITHNEKLAQLTKKRYVLSDGQLFQQQEDGL